MFCLVEWAYYLFRNSSKVKEEIEEIEEITIDNNAIRSLVEEVLKESEERNLKMIDYVISSKMDNYNMWQHHKVSLDSPSDDKKQCWRAYL